MQMNEKGLSLMEVLAAMMVMGLLLMALGGGFNQSFITSNQTKHYIYAIEDAKKIIEQVRYIAETNGLTGANSVTDSDYWSNSGHTGWLQTAAFSDLPNPTRTVDFPNGTGGNPVRVRAQVQWAEARGAFKHYTLETLVTQRGENP